ncbi:MAG: hypothetical protein Q7K13_00695, partial [Polynucleobacter sp.]|uniref:hypothetical protein n=1 Tax=Polynucleobacter sp. TaxID=2029855 RepID=UPI0027293828
MILTTDLRDWIVIPTLRFMEPEVPYTKAAVRLMLGTIAQESSGGMWLDQGTLGAGPAYGIAQMEEPTYYDHCTWMAAFNKALFEKFCELVPHSSMV